MVDRGSPIPIYFQLKETLIKMIDDEVFKVGDKIYTESEVCRTYGVSSITAKRVLDELAQEGFITRHPGRGSFVTQKKPISHTLTNFYSFTEELRQKGLKPSSETVYFGLENPPSKCAELFKLEKGEKILKIQRKRFAENNLVALDFSHLRSSAGEFINEKMLESASLYEIFQANGLTPDYAEESFDAVQLGREDAKIMNLSHGVATLKVTRQTYSNGIPFEYNYRYYVPNTYLYSIKLGLNS